MKKPVRVPSRRQFLVSTGAVTGLLLVGCGDSTDDQDAGGAGGAARTGGADNEKTATTAATSAAGAVARLQGRWGLYEYQGIDRWRSMWEGSAEPSDPDSGYGFDSLDDTTDGGESVSEEERLAWWWLSGTTDDATPATTQVIDQLLLESPQLESMDERRNAAVSFYRDGFAPMTTAIDLADGEALLSDGEWGAGNLYGEVDADYTLAEGELALRWRLTWAYEEEDDLSGYTDFQVRYSTELVRPQLAVARLTSVAAVDDEGRAPEQAGEPFCSLARVWWSEDGQVGTLFVRSEPAGPFMADAPADVGPKEPEHTLFVLVRR